MIDPCQENLIALRDLPEKLPKRHGKRIHISTVYRWAQRGLRGGIRLETVKVGGGRYTSQEAVHRFVEAVTRHDGGAAAEDEPEVKRRMESRSSHRRLTREQARREVHRILGESRFDSAT